MIPAALFFARLFPRGGGEPAEIRALEFAPDFFTFRLKKSAVPDAEKAELWFFDPSTSEYEKLELTVAGLAPEKKPEQDEDGPTAENELEPATAGPEPEKRPETAAEESETGKCGGQTGCPPFSARISFCGCERFWNVWKFETQDAEYRRLAMRLSKVILDYVGLFCDGDEEGMERLLSSFRPDRSHTSGSLAEQERAWRELPRWDGRSFNNTSNVSNVSNIGNTVNHPDCHSVSRYRNQKTSVILPEGMRAGIALLSPKLWNEYLSVSLNEFSKAYFTRHSVWPESSAQYKSITADGASASGEASASVSNSALGGSSASDGNCVACAASVSGVVSASGEAAVSGKGSAPCETFTPVRTSRACRENGKDMENRIPPAARIRISVLVIGNPFCSLLFPDLETLAALLTKMAREKVLPVIVLPPMAEGETAEITRRLEWLDAWCKEQDTVLDIECNDFGEAEIVREQGYRRFCLAAGVLLARRRKDPRLFDLPGMSVRHVASTSCDDPAFAQLFPKERETVETCGYLPKISFRHATLYGPYFQQNTGRFCPMAAAVETGNRGRQKRKTSCPGYCEHSAFLYPDDFRMAGIGNSICGFDTGIWDAGYLCSAALAGADRLIFDFPEISPETEGKY